MNPTAEKTVADALREAGESAAVVAVKRTDGKTFEGVPTPTEDPLVFAIRTGRRGRPARVHVDDVEEVS